MSTTTETEQFVEDAWSALQGSIDDLRFAGIPVEEIRADVEKSLTFEPIEGTVFEIIGGPQDGAMAIRFDGRVSG